MQFQYDNLNQLQVADHDLASLQDADIGVGAGNETVYDANGNILQITLGGTTKTYTYYPGTNKVQNTDGSGNDYVYDLNGNMRNSTPKNITSMNYDPSTQMTKSITISDGTTKSLVFEYGAENQRVMKTYNDYSTPIVDMTSLYLHGNNEYPLLEKSKSPITPESRVICVYGPTGLLAMQKEGEVYYALKDHLGSTRVLVDEAGTVAAYFDYAPFGSLMRSGVNTDIAYRFTGQEFDSESELHNFRARLYDSDLGRFYATDPGGQTPSPYLYAGNNPIIYVDPDGRLFGIDDLIISGVSFIVGYTMHGITTGHWGKDALASGAIAAGSALIAYNTGGTAAGLLFKEHTIGYALTAATVGGAVGGAAGSAASQYYYTGDIRGKDVWTAAGIGAAGGFAGGFAGQYLTSDPVLTSMIGGAVGGGIEGSLHGQWFHGAFIGAYSGAYSGALTAVAYEEYGKFMTNKMLGDGAYGNDYSGVPKDWPAEYQGDYPADCYDCVAFSSDWYHTYGEKGNLLYWDVSTVNYQGMDYTTQHYGIALGRTQYGQTMVLSKIGTMFPIIVKTDAYLNSIFGKYTSMPWSQRFGR